MASREAGTGREESRAARVKPQEPLGQVGVQVVGVHKTRGCTLCLILRGAGVFPPLSVAGVT